VTQAIVPASPGKQTGLTASWQYSPRHDLEIARRTS
jgi:hypothetical protein